MNGRVAKRLRRAVNDMYGGLNSTEARTAYRELKKSYATQATEVSPSGKVYAKTTANPQASPELNPSKDKKVE